MHISEFYAGYRRFKLTSGLNHYSTSSEYSNKDKIEQDADSTAKRNRTLNIFIMNIEWE